MRAVITAGGEGTRLYPSSRAFPKELFHFAGIPVIEHGISLLRENGIKDVYVVTGRKKGALQDYLGSGEIFGVNIAYITQEEPKGLGDAVLCTRPYIEDSKEDDFVLVLGDTIFEGSNDLGEMLIAHSAENAVSTILVEKIQEPERYGVVKFKTLDENYGEIGDFYEKPETREVKEAFSYFDGMDYGWFAIAGLYVLNKCIFDYIENTPPAANNEIQLTDALKLSVNDNAKALGYVMDGRRIDVGTWDYLRLERNYYKGMSDDDLEKIISGRKGIMERMRNNRK